MACMSGLPMASSGTGWCRTGRPMAPLRAVAIFAGVGASLTSSMRLLR
ncbi:MAG: hypothetical protein QOG96_3565 [Pseudonocardiales bacterium]|nr:hypothetical protein [Pseudonocardiales bacterium]